MSDDPATTASAPGSRWRWARLLWMLAALFAGAAGLSALTARQVSQPVEALLTDELTQESPESAPFVVTAAPTIVVIEISQVLKPVRDRVTSLVTVFLLEARDAASSTAPAHRPLLEMDHEFSRTPEKADMSVTTHATLMQPGTYRLALGRMEPSYEGAAGPVRVRVDRVRASAVPFEAGAVGMGLLAIATTLAATVVSAVQYVARLRREDEARA